MAARIFGNSIPLCTLGAVICGVCGGGCVGLFHTKSVSNQADAASVSFAVLSVAPWNSYRDAMEPKFNLSADQALGLAVPNTMSLEGKVLEAFEAEAKIALPGAAVPRETSNSPAGGRTVSALPPESSVLSNPPGIDPILKYQAANALYQEVQIMNRYLENAAVFEGYTPYVVTLQVSIMPRARGLADDAYSEISFFQGKWGTSASNVMVLPLLATDDIESMMQSHSVEEVTRFAAALSAAVHGVTASGDVENAYDKLQAVLGRNLNSTFMVGRVSDNTLRCRFGASYQSESEYAMVPQTHTVTLLVMVPGELAESKNRDDRTVRMVARTTLVDIATGRTLRNQSEAEAHRRMEKLLASYGIYSGYSQSTEEKLFSDLAGNNYGDFKQDFLGLHPAYSNYVEAAWIKMIALRDRSPISSATFAVPQFEPAVLVGGFGTANRTPLLVDDGTATSASLADCVDLAASQIGAILTVTSPQNGTLNFIADKVSVSGEGSTISMSFPSLCSYARPLTNGDGSVTASLELFTVGRGGKLLFMAAHCGYERTPPQAKAGFTMSTRSRYINADSANGGSCDVVFAVKKSGTGIRFNVEGAEATACVISNTSVLPLTPDGDGWKLATNAIVRLDFRNLTPLSPIVITATDTSNKAVVSAITLPVIPFSGRRGVLHGN